MCVASTRLNAWSLEEGLVLGLSTAPKGNVSPDKPQTTQRGTALQGSPTRTCMLSLDDIRVL
eukprot:766690-Prymnesium_polylepis.3